MSISFSVTCRRFWITSYTLTKYYWYHIVEIAGLLLLLRGNVHAVVHVLVRRGNHVDGVAQHAIRGHQLCVELVLRGLRAQQLVDRAADKVDRILTDVGCLLLIENDTRVVHQLLETSGFADHLVRLLQPLQILPSVVALGANQYIHYEILCVQTQTAKCTFTAALFTNSTGTWRFISFERLFTALSR